MKKITFTFTDEEAGFINDALTTDVPNDLTFEQKFSDHVTQRIINPLLATGVQVSHFKEVQSSIEQKSSELMRTTFAEQAEIAKAEAESKE